MSQTERAAVTLARRIGWAVVAREAGRKLAAGDERMGRAMETGARSVRNLSPIR